MLQGVCLACTDPDKLDMVMSELTNMSDSAADIDRDNDDSVWQ